VDHSLARNEQLPGVEYYALPFQAPEIQFAEDAVEVAHFGVFMGDVHIRGTLKLNRVVVVTRQAWLDFVAAVKRGEYDERPEAGI
jgi:hypothetical protein